MFNVMESRSPPVSPTVVAQIFMIQKMKVTVATLLAMGPVSLAGVGTIMLAAFLLRKAASGLADRFRGYTQRPRM